MTGHSPIKITAAPNALKESLSARDAAAAIKQGLLKALPGITVVQVPLADGGDGMLQALLAVKKEKEVSLTAADPLGKTIPTKYAVLEDGTAVVEMSLVSGLNLIPREKRKALKASSSGMGQVIAHAIKRGCRKFIVGIGGSATTDGGAGMAQALGISLLDKSGKPIAPGGEGLINLWSIDTTRCLPELDQCSFQVACDVVTPMLGPTGAARTYAPQKGASPEEVEILEKNLKHFADLMESTLHKKCRDLPGTGAAGGIGFAFTTLFDAKLVPGAELILELVDFEEKCRGSDLIITAEGALDEQSSHGKLPAVVSQKGKQLGIPVIALAGALKPGWEKLKSQGLTAAFSIAPGPVSLKYSMENAFDLLAAAAAEAVGLFMAGKTEVNPHL
jgi:glycerate kinase